MCINALTLLTLVNLINFTFFKVLETTPRKTADVRPPTTHQENHPY